MFHSRNRSRFSVVAAALLATAGILLAGDAPWKDKPYDKWDASDIQRILTDSPWVQITTIQRNWLPVSGKDTPPPQELSGGNPKFPGATGNPNAADSRQAETSVRQLNVYVFWGSSRVMRAALARQAVLRGSMQEADVEKQASAPQQEYDIVLQMADMTPFLRSDEKSFQDKAFLQMKKGKLKLPANRVTYQRDSSGRVGAVIFFFPKQTSEGAPSILPEETDVQFNCRIADTNLRVNFKPPKMQDQQGRDL